MRDIGARRAAGWALLCAGCQPLAAHAQGDVEICSPSFDVQDPEFSPDFTQLSYINAAGEVRVIDLDTEGMPSGGDCSGQLVDTGAVWKVPDLTFRQGPEWGRSRRGLELFYTRRLPDGRPSLARAWRDASGWHTETLPNGEDRGMPMASVDADDAQPRIMYLRRMRGGGYLPVWREVDAVQEEKRLPVTGDTETGSVPRWVPGQRKVTTAKPDASGVMQGAVVDIDSGRIVFATEGPGRKGEAWVWRAPEFGHARVMTVVVDGSMLQVWRDIGHAWQLVHSVAASSFTALPLVYSPEPFVHEGRSYVALQVGIRKIGPSEFWVVAIDPASPLAVRVSGDSSLQSTSAEPEWLAAGTGAFVCYSQYNVRFKAGLRRTPLIVP
jgi:hypothetical protein